MTISLAEPAGVRQGITDHGLRILAGTTATERTAMLSAPPNPMQQMRCPFPGGELILVVDFDPPAWLTPTAETLVALLGLPSGWDSYGAQAIAPSHVDAALQVLLRIMRRDSPTPAVVPTNRGGVQLEWHTSGIDLEIETLSTQRLLVSFQDATTGTEWEGEIVANLARLVEYIERLS